MKRSNSNLWDYISAINFSKVDLFKDNHQADKDYIPFIVNKSLSFFPDALFYANEINKYPNAAKQWQFDFLRWSLSKRKRFAKWTKKNTVDPDLKYIQQFYNMSTQKAQDILKILTKDQIQKIKESLDVGGTQR